MIHNKHCAVCDEVSSEEVIHDKTQQKDDISFAALLALVPAMTMTLFSLMGFI